MEILIGLGIGLLLITLVGHGIWVLLASIFGGGSDRSAQRPIQRQIPHCPRCDAELASHACPVCDWPAAPVQRRSWAALAALERQLQRLEAAQAIGPDVAARLNAAIGEARRELSTPRADRLPLEVTAQTDAPAESPVSVAAEFETPEAVPAEIVVPELPRKVEPTRGADPAEAVPLAAAQSGSGEIARQLEDRVRQFVEQRNSLAPEPAAAPTPRAPRRPWSDVLAGFMEEKNIRWGELVGGLLIVCCSIALVISFWAKIAERPFLKFFVFGGVTAALFAVGFYTERRWKLQTTSRGLLVIATLLVPLNFLAIAALDHPSGARALFVLGEVLSVVLFAGLVGVAGRILTPRGATALAVGVMVPAVMQLVERRLVESDASGLLLAGLGAISLVFYCGANAWSVAHDRRETALDESQAHGLFRLLGLTTFSVLLALGLLVAKTGHAVDALHRVAPLVCALGWAPLAVGLLVARRLAAAAPASVRVAGTSVAIAGAVISLAALVLAWPEPGVLLPAVVAEIILFEVIALVVPMPAAQVVVVASSALGYLLGIYLLRGDVRWWGTTTSALRPVLWSASSGVALVPLVALWAGGAGLVARWRRPADALSIAGAAAAVACVSLLLASWFGAGISGDPYGVRWVFAAYACGALASATVAGRWQPQRAWPIALGWLGSLLALAAVVEAVVFRWGAAQQWLWPWPAALLAHAGLMALLSVALRRWGARGTGAVDRASTHSALAGSLVAVPLVAWGIWRDLYGAAAGECLALAAIWLALSALLRRPRLFWVAEAALGCGAALSVLARLAGHAWFRDAQHPWLDPWTWQALGVALAVVGLGLSGTRYGWRRLALARPGNAQLELGRWLIDTQRPKFERFLAALLVTATLAVAYYAALPGIEQELSPRARSSRAAVPAGAAPLRIVPPASQFEVAGISHEHAGGYGAWCLLAATAVLVLVGFWERPSLEHAFGLYLLAAACCPLWASRWEADVSVASALRWASAALLLVGSIPIWLRGPLGRLAERVSPRLGRPGWQKSAGRAPAIVLALGLAPPLLMAVYIGTSASLRVNHDLATVRLLEILTGVFFVTGVMGLALRWVDLPAAKLAGHPEPGTWLRPASSLVLVLGAAPLVALVLYVVGSSLQQMPILGPNPDSPFARMGSASSHAVPLLTLAVVLVGYALRERSEAFAFAGGLTFNLAITAGYLLLLAKRGLRFDALGWMRLAQLNALVSAVFVLAWMGTLRWSARRAQPGGPGRLSPLALVTLGLAAMLLVGVVVPIWAHFAFATLDVALVREAASVVGWASTLLVVAGVVWARRWLGHSSSIGGLCAALFVLGVMMACTAAHWDPTGALAYHTLLVAQSLIAWTIWGVAWHRERLFDRTWRQPPAADPAAGEPTSIAAGPAAPLRATGLWPVGLFAALALWLSLRALFDGPDRPWWGIAGLASLAALAVRVAYARVDRRLLFVAMALVNLVTSAWWWTLGAPWRGWGGEPLTTLVEWNIIALALPAVAWLYLELARFRSLAARRTPAAHRFAARASLVALALLVGLKLAADLASQAPPEFAWLDWCALAAVAIAVAASLWDAEAPDSVAGLYVLGLVAAGLLLDQLNLDPHWLVWTGTIVLAAYTVLTSYLWSIRRQLAAVAGRWKIPLASESPWAGLAWLVPANLTIVSAVLALVYLVELTYGEFSLRLLAGQAALAQVLSLVLVAQGTRRTSLQYASLAVGVVALVAFGWAWLDPVAVHAGNAAATGAVLNRLVVVAAALAGAIVLYGFGLARWLDRQSEWRRAARRLLPVLVPLVILALLSITGVELLLQLRHAGVALAWPGIVAVAAILLALAIAALVAAVLPGRDPLGLSSQGRTAYVYAAELFLGLLMAHIRLSMPWLFHGFFAHWWPLVVMGLAFLGVALGEYFQRRRLAVLAEPLGNTAALMPLLPAIGFWLMPAGVDYSVVLVVIGALYALLSGIRGSFAFGLLAALSANAALWFFLHGRDGYRIVEHPQLWLIPPALCVLAASYLHRRQLTAGQLAAVRYATSIVVYVSSTADIFINGVGQAPWLPLVLAGLSILGILVGIWLRVRAFLLLGTAFLLVSLLTIIWYAAVDLQQTWLWWAMGIVTGILIIALFAVFEKKRDDVLKLVEDLKHWQV